MIEDKKFDAEIKKAVAEFVNSLLTIAEHLLAIDGSDNRRAFIMNAFTIYGLDLIAKAKEGELALPWYTAKVKMLDFL